MKSLRSRLGDVSVSTLVLVAIVVVVLVVADVVLVGLALGRNATLTPAKAGPIPTFSSAPQPTVTATPTTPSASSSASASAAATAEKARLVSVVNATEAWRAVTGSCGGTSPTFEHSVDAGSTWQTVSFGNVQVDQIAAVRSSSSQVWVLAGVGSSCSVEALTSTDGGKTWTTTTDRAATGAGIVGGTLYLTDGTSAAAPCTSPARVYEGASTTAVACPDTFEWRKGTGSWVDVPITGISSFASNGTNYTLAREGVAGCAGVSIDTLPVAGVTAASAATQVGCDTDVKNPKIGRVGIGQDNSTVWVWDGSHVAVSTDGGASW